MTLATDLIAAFADLLNTLGIDITYAGGTTKAAVKILTQEWNFYDQYVAQPGDIVVKLQSATVPVPGTTTIIVTSTEFQVPNVGTYTVKAAREYLMGSARLCWEMVATLDTTGPTAPGNVRSA